MYIQEIRLLSILIMLPLLLLSYCVMIMGRSFTRLGFLRTPKRKFIFLHFWLFRGVTSFVSSYTLKVLILKISNNIHNWLGEAQFGINTYIDNICLPRLNYIKKILPKFIYTNFTKQPCISLWFVMNKEK